MKREKRQRGRKEEVEVDRSIDPSSSFFFFASEFRAAFLPQKLIKSNSSLQSWEPPCALEAPCAIKGAKERAASPHNDRNEELRPWRRRCDCCFFFFQPLSRALDAFFPCFLSPLFQHSSAAYTGTLSGSRRWDETQNENDENTEESAPCFFFSLLRNREGKKWNTNSRRKRKEEKKEKEKKPSPLPHLGV